MNMRDIETISDYLGQVDALAKKHGLSPQAVVAMFQAHATWELMNAVGSLVGGTVRDERTGQQPREGLLQTGQDLVAVLESLTSAVHNAGDTA